jgi:hypothetical protein
MSLRRTEFPRSPGCAPVSWGGEAAAIEGVGGLLARYNLKCASIIPDHFAQKRWGSGAPKAGVTIDTGHSFFACEDVAEAAVMLSMYGDKLFHLHFNDNDRYWDDDMIVGLVHFVEYVELLFWLREMSYAGWYSMDKYPYREKAQGALLSVALAQPRRLFIQRVAVPPLSQHRRSFQGSRPAGR